MKHRLIVQNRRVVQQVASFTSGQEFQDAESRFWDDENMKFLVLFLLLSEAAADPLEKEAFLMDMGE